MTEIERIKQALAQATEERWQQEGREVWHRGLSYDSAVDRHRWICDVISDADRNLIANAPTWLASLITTVESLQKELDKCGLVWEEMGKEAFEMQDLIDSQHAHILELQAVIESQKEEIERLQKENKYLLECQEVIESVQGMDADGNMPESIRCKHGFNVNLFCVQCIDEKDKQEGDKTNE